MNFSLFVMLTTKLPTAFTNTWKQIRKLASNFQSSIFSSTFEAFNYLVINANYCQHRCGYFLIGELKNISG